MSIQILPPDPKKSRNFYSAFQVETGATGYGQSEQEAVDNLKDSPKYKDKYEVETEWQEGVHH
jgi:hypothetical protein